jgi:hypothetical protein
MHVRALPAPEPERVEALEAKLADGLLEDATRGAGDPALLRLVVRHFPETEAGEKAARRLGDARQDADELALDRELLLANPTLLGPGALALDPRLVDGRGENGELASTGVSLVPPAALRLRLVDDGDPDVRVETRALAPDAWSKAHAAAQDALYARLLTAERRDPETGRFERYIPFFVQGTVGDGVYLYPGVKYRRYRSDDRALYEE